MDWDDERYREVYDEGRRHFYSNDGRLENPYPRGSEEYDVFERGWVQACRLSSEGAPYRKPTGNSLDFSLAEKYEHMGESRRRFNDVPKYNAYAAAKGKE